MDERGQWMKKMEDPDGDYVVELVETYDDMLRICHGGGGFTYYSRGNFFFLSLYVCWSLRL